jgi:hypothetical protein
MTSVKQNKANGKKREELTLETLPSSSLFGEPQTQISPIQSEPYTENALEDAIVEFELETEELAPEAEEKDELQTESTSHGDLRLSSRYHSGIPKRP